MMRTVAWKLKQTKDSLSYMNIRFPADRRASWRLRFLEIARQVEGSGTPTAKGFGGLRPRSKMAGYATLRRTRRATGLGQIA